MKGDTCFLQDSEGKVFSWGKNNCGELGHGDLENRNYPTEC